MFELLCFTLSLALVSLEVSGHGMMLDPPNRSSLWRFDDDAPVNYDDNSNFCGGLGSQWWSNDGNCGVCGDDYALPHPQPNENTGIYGTGKIVAEYKAGQIVETSILITSNHNGHFEYHLCELQDPSTHESGEDCFKLLQFEDGSNKYPIKKEYVEVTNRIKLPDEFTCEHCVLRWHYRAGNNWGVCDDGTQGIGCGPQENYRSCADVKIV